MAKTNLNGRSNRDFISSRWLWITLTAAILCSSSVSAFSLFSSEFFTPLNYRVQALGNILSIDRGMDYDFSKTRWLEINTSFLYLSMLRDSVYLNNFLPNFSIWLDMIMLPGFIEYEDTGISNIDFPFSFALGVKYYFLHDEVWDVNLSAYGGLELIPDYNYFFNPVYGMTANGRYRVLEPLYISILIGSSDFKSVTAEAGVMFRFDAIDCIGAFALDGNYKVLKAGFVYRLSPGFSILLGGNYTLEYNGWNLTAGLELSKIQIFSIESLIGLGFAYNLVGGASFVLSWNMEFSR